MKTITARRRRDGLTILADILETMDLPIKPTHVLYRTNLSHPQLKKYLQLLVSMGFAQELEKPSHSFVVTEKGRMFVQLIESYPRNDARANPAILHKPKDNNEPKVEDGKLEYNILTTMIGEYE
jgi:predicted transcriptional regulator